MTGRHEHPDAPAGHEHDRGDEPHTHTVRVLDRSAVGPTVTLADTAHWADGTSADLREWTVGCDPASGPPPLLPGGHPSPEGLATMGHDLVSLDQVAACDDPTELLLVLSLCQAPVPDPSGCVPCAASARHAALAALAAPSPAPAGGGRCGRCALPTVRNPDPDVPADDAWVCIRCLRADLTQALTDLAQAGSRPTALPDPRDAQDPDRP